MIAEKERSRKELARLGKHIIDGMLIQIFHPQSATATLIKIVAVNFYHYYSIFLKS